MDIKSGCAYPASALSNFAPHPFEIDGVKCASMEGFLQSLKFKAEPMQVYICSLVGLKAKFAGKHKAWWKTQTLYWQGKEYKRDSQEYQDLLDRAFKALSQNRSFKAALCATNDAVLTHSIGKSDASKTVLTRSEFCGRLMKLRKDIHA